MDYLKLQLARSQAGRDKIRDEGRVVIYAVGKRLQVVCPLNAEFRAEAPKLKGRWKYRTKVWSFPCHALPYLTALAERCFGTSKVEVLQ